MKSILTNNLSHCFICGTSSNIQIHHIFFGSNRKLADEDGLTIPLCINHHTGFAGVHSNNGHELNIKLKKLAESKWLEYYNKTIDDFICRYGKNYL